jgi:hypothetical protein
MPPTEGSCDVLWGFTSTSQGAHAGGRADSALHVRPGATPRKPLTAVMRGHGTRAGKLPARVSTFSR